MVVLLWHVVVAVYDACRGGIPKSMHGVQDLHSISTDFQTEVHTHDDKGHDL